MNTFIQISTLLDPLFLVVAALSMGVLSLAVYRSNRTSATNIIFIFLNVSILFWLWAGYMAGLPSFEMYAIIFHRLAIFFAAPMSALFLLLAYTIPSETLLISKRNFWCIVVLTCIMMAFNISPFAFVAVGNTTNLAPGIGILPFSIISSVFSLLAVYYLSKKYTVSEKEVKTQLRIVLIGMFGMIFLIIATILVPIVFFHSLAFLPLLSVYVLIFIGMTGYAITRYKLFNIKVFLTQAIIIVIWITLFSKIFVEDTLMQQVVDALIFLVTVIFGISLIRTVRREVQQRMQIQSLADDLSMANENQIALIHFITHQVKGFFTKSRNIFSLLSEGEAGTLTPEMKRFIDEGFDSDTKGVAMVQNVLNAANIRSGIVKYSMEAFDLSTLISAIVIEYRKMAEDRGLTLDFSCWGKEQDGANGSSGASGSIPNCVIDMKTRANYTVKGDEEQLRHVYKNLIENAIRYTQHGSILIRLTQSVADSSVNPNIPHTIIFSVKDTGVGLSDEDKKLLFTQGGKGKDSVKINVESTGYGLFIAKGIVEAHHGKIWAESEGRDKGSTFFVEMPGV